MSAGAKEMMSIMAMPTMGCKRGGAGGIMAGNRTREFNGFLAIAKVR
jgi:hypothetical protein